MGWGSRCLMGLYIYGRPDWGAGGGHCWIKKDPVDEIYRKTKNYNETPTSI